ncbi:Ser-Thr-rich glycosyl-phosphatidyl-inositol-anchored membrane family-domain-containing protein [Poronia punctata]|nr:Ser-Thr-rich glycosyl-phosphatidyl-inositol-anchored membrane family-domain-containing protein [Poronia punctata]
MRSSTVFASVLAFAASAFAADPTEGYAVVLSPTEGDNVPAGETFTVKWDAGSFTGPADIALLAGKAPGLLEVVESLAAGVNVEEGTFAWAVDCSLGEDKVYGLMISSEADDGATFQYSFPFHVKGPSCAATTSATSSVVTSSVVTSSSVSASSTKYPVESSTSAVETTSTSTIKTTTTAKPTSYPATTFTSLITITTSTSGSGSVTPYPTGTTTTTSAQTSGPATTTTASPVPTAGAAHVGAGLAFGLAAMAFAL